MHLQASHCLRAMLCLLLALRLVGAHNISLLPRDDDPQTSIIATAADPTSDAEPSRTTVTEPSATGKTESEKSHSSGTHTITSMSATTQVKSTASSSMLATSGGFNDPYFNVTIPEGHLPLTPEITPGWAVAGIVLLLTGAAYALIGIRNRWVHTFFSTAYLAALGITVLIVYVMNVPVSKALQGGYVAAIIVSSCAAGAASIFFKELTEGLGCAVGGFCLSMWLLTLVPGGLIDSQSGRAIFISVFTVVAFAFYFSHYTRDWALMTMISFGGATVCVLGIDSFSRAGLKEFWAYVWDLNDDLFPLGATTYPVTKGIRVETAAIIILCLAGIISQVKLWKIIRDKREKKAAQMAEAQRDLDQEEANLGRQVEETNARERRQWERTYGDGSGGGSTLSDLGDANSEKRLRSSQVETAKEESVMEVIEMNELSEERAPDPLMAGDGDHDGKVTVRVAQDDIPEGSSEHDGGPVDFSHRLSQQTATEQPPAVVPLPFKVPLEEDDAQSRADRSSVATFADEADNQPIPARASRVSLAKRVSQGSATLLRSLSQRSNRNLSDLSPKTGESSDDLVTPDEPKGADQESLAATFDGESLDGSLRQSFDRQDDHEPIEITARLAETSDTITNMPHQGHDEKRQSHMISSEVVLPTASASAAPVSPSLGNTAGPHASESESRDDQAGPSKPKSTVSRVSSVQSISKEKLPRSLSKVAMSYRTNEWAKHLSHAETPEPDALEIIHSPRAPESKLEKAAPVVLEDLQQTAAQGVPRKASFIKRSESQMSTLSQAEPWSSEKMSNSKGAQSIDRDGDRSQKVTLQNPTTTNSPPFPSSRRQSLNSVAGRRTSGGFEPIAEEQHVQQQAQIPISRPGSVAGDDVVADALPPSRSLSALRLKQPSPASPVPGVVSHSSPQTLLGQRDMMLRSRSSQNLLASIAEPDAASMRAGGTDADSLANYPLYAAAISADPDDVPLSQRKTMIRQSSMKSFASAQLLSNPSPPIAPVDGISHSASFNSHQPQRVSTAPTFAQRESQLAQFRQSVANDLRAGTPMRTAHGRETPFASTSGVLSGGREVEVQRNIEMQRNMMMSQKEADAQRREMERQQKDWQDRAFDERMRSPGFLEAHREVMRKMQNSAK